MVIQLTGQHSMPQQLRPAAALGKGDRKFSETFQMIIESRTPPLDSAAYNCSAL